MKIVYLLKYPNDGVFLFNLPTNIVMQFDRLVKSSTNKDSLEIGLERIFFFI